ncbi:Acg family FMN-binding oxidoreductase [Dactylosporangium cerinum]|uniref:Acg family FMN-binding oxidoreductase n=1 Tax=Dactylosporangium cerinum TaxID=1434730 RepID=A0ABV9VQH9_9ACTN
MAAIQYTDRGTAVRVSPAGRALTEAVLAALGAPSILNTQPWHWRIDGDTAQLRADRTRQLATIDPDGRLLTVSCGAALHHARVALAADGVAAEVTYLPDGDDPDLLATVRHAGTVERSAESQRLRRAMSIRRTDRRPFADQDVPEAALDQLRAAATAAGADLHVVRPQDRVAVVVAAGHAADVEQEDPAYRAELAAWVRDGAEDGVPPATAAAGGPRPVPIRDFTGTAAGQVSVYAGGDVADRHARYAVLVTEGDLARDWLAAGEALSAVLLAAVGAGLGASPMSDLVEVAPARAMLRRMLGEVGHPAMVVRIGVPTRQSAAGSAEAAGSTEAGATAAAEAGGVPVTPRRPSVSVVDLVTEPMEEGGEELPK